MRPNESLPKLLRAIAGGTDAKASRHDIIFSAAADEIERLRAGYREILHVQKQTEHVPQWIVDLATDKLRLPSYYSWRDEQKSDAK